MRALKNIVVSLSLLSAGCENFSAKNFQQGPTSTNASTVTANYLNQNNPVDKVALDLMTPDSKIWKDPTTGKERTWEKDYKGSVENIVNAVEAINPGYRQMVASLNASVLNKSPLKESGSSGSKSAMPVDMCISVTLPNGNANPNCPNVCAYAAAFASATACAVAEAFACAACWNSDGAYIQVCAQARDSQCRSAFGVGFALACTNGLTIAGGGAGVGGSGDFEGQIDIETGRSKALKNSGSIEAPPPGDGGGAPLPNPQACAVAVETRRPDAIGQCPAGFQLSTSQNKASCVPVSH